jgi:hypothetical protein
MTTNVLRLLVSVTSAACLGCAGVNFYSDAKLETRTGIPIFATKPYLLVVETGSSEKPIEVTVVHLRDDQRVIYADPRSGFGSSNLTLTLADGQLTSFGQQTDPKIPELIDSISGFITARADAARTARASEPTKRDLSKAFELYEISQDASGTRLRRVDK